MPKLAKTDNQKLDLNFTVVLAKNSTALEYTKEHFERWLKISRVTWLARRKEPEKLTLKEIRVLVKKLHCSDEEILSFIK